MKVKITFLGDIFPANLHYTIGFGVASQFAKHNGAPWIKTIRDYLYDSNIVFGNLESPLIGKFKKPEETSFAGDISFANFLKKIGINILSVANNHILEQGKEGFFSTIKALENQCIKYIGKYENGTSNIEIFKINNMSIGFAAFNAIHDISNPNLYANYSEYSVIKALELMSSLNLDFKIISIHWGNEFINIPKISQIQSARKFIDEGADIIVGHHSHVVQPIERYKDGLIIYCLGNFIFDMVWSENVRTGMFVKVELEKNKKISYCINPIYINDNYLPCRREKDNDFMKLLKRYENKINKSNSILQKKYDNYYKRTLLFNNIYQRMMMKIFLLKNYRMISNQTKKLIMSRFLK